MDISCSFATSLETPRHIAEAEQLGFKRAFCFDSPALYADVWIALALASQQTSVIGLGPCVRCTPASRHDQRHGIATLAHLPAGSV
jgi:5,10-methylenetetrahydromethanopterin reductase